MPFRLHNRHPVPVGFEFIGDNLCHRRPHLLAHIGAVAGHAHGAVRFNGNPQRGGGVTTGDGAQSTGGRVSRGRAAPQRQPDDECTGTRDEAAAAEVQQRFLMPTVYPLCLSSTVFVMPYHRRFSSVVAVLQPL